MNDGVDPDPTQQEREKAILIDLEQIPPSVLKVHPRLALTLEHRVR